MAERLTLDEAIKHCEEKQIAHNVVKNIGSLLNG